MSADRIEFSEPVRFRAEPGLNHAVARAARQARTSSAEWMRRALRERLAADGVALPALDGGDGPRTPPAAPAMRQAA
ncbi:hypothetical protein SAMN02799622_03538 [Methylobacterium sp. UNC378MF]|jgi:hypothetical protein|nr:hypothetical protein SAMN02799622_03538 [Methylobacterium sp. UNC378MF]